MMIPSAFREIFPFLSARQTAHYLTSVVVEAKHISVELCGLVFIISFELVQLIEIASHLHY